MREGHGKGLVRIGVQGATAGLCKTLKGGGRRAQARAMRLIVGHISHIPHLWQAQVVPRDDPPRLVVVLPQHVKEAHRIRHAQPDARVKLGARPGRELPRRRAAAGGCGGSWGWVRARRPRGAGSRGLLPSRDFRWLRAGRGGGEGGGGGALLRGGSPGAGQGLGATAAPCRGCRLPSSASAAVTPAPTGPSGGAILIPGGRAHGLGEKGGGG